MIAFGLLYMFYVLLCLCLPVLVDDVKVAMCFVFYLCVLLCSVLLLPPISDPGGLAPGSPRPDPLVLGSCPRVSYPNNHLMHIE